MLEEECVASVTAPEVAESPSSTYSPSGPLYVILQPQAMALSASAPLRHLEMFLLFTSTCSLERLS